MAFYIKNIARAPITAFGSEILPNSRLDLTTVASTAQIIASLLNGELFKKITGRALAIVDINNLLAIGATVDEISSFARIGYFQGKLGEEDFKELSATGADGYTMVSLSLPVDSDGYLLINVANTAPSASDWVSNYSTVYGDGYAVRASDTTITFTGPTITTSQLRSVIVDTGTSVSVYEQGRNSVRLSISGSLITINGAGLVPIPAGSTVNVSWEGQEKAYDSSTQTVRSFPVIDLASRRVDTPVSLISAAQNLTASWADLGPEIAVSGYTRLTLWAAVDINDGYNVRLRCLAKHTPASALEYVMPILKSNTTTDGYFAIYAEDEYIELNDDADQNMILTWVVENTIPYVQLQVMAVTPGANPAQIDAAEITYAWGT